MDIGVLSAKYEASGNPGTISDGAGDLGGASYGAFQFNSADDIVTAFLDWVIDNEEEPLRNYAVVLKDLGVYTASFDAKWRELASVDPEGFSKLQSDYAAQMYFVPAAEALMEEYGLVATERSKTLQAVILSRAIHYGAGWVPELFYRGFLYAKEINDPAIMESIETVEQMPDYYLIGGIYDYLYNDASQAYQLASGRWHSPDDWANGSRDVIGGLKNRFASEKLDAYALLEEEYAASAKSEE